jgi:hypothetical protein
MKRDVQIRQAPLDVDLIYFSKRADSGNAHSMENPSFVAGAAGGCGSVSLEPDDCAALRFDDLVSRPIASTVSAGGCHGRRFIAPVPSDFIGCIACPRNNRACKRSMGSLWAWQGRHKIMPKWLTRPLFNPVPRTFHLRRQACVLPAKSCTLHRYRDQAETASSLLRNKSLLGSVQ